MKHLPPQEAPWRGSGRGSSFTGDPRRYVEKVSGYRHLSPWGPLFCQGEPGVWGTRITETLTGERRRALVVGHHSARDSTGGP